MEGIRWAQKAYSKNQNIPDLNADLAFFHSVVGVSPNRTPQEKEEYFNKSNQLFIQFEQTNGESPYIYYVWSRALAIQERYKESLDKLIIYKERRGSRDVADFKQGLKERIAQSK